MAGSSSMQLGEFLGKVRTGELSVDEIGRGQHKSYRNACTLVEDAEALLANRPARALSLAALAMEEIAKVVLLANGAAAAGAATGTVSWEKLARVLKLKSHAVKQAIFAGYGSALLDEMAKKKGRKRYYDISVPGGAGPLLDWMKQLGFYVDVANGRFISPEEFGADNREWAEWVIAAAKERIESLRGCHGTEADSIRFARRVAELGQAFRQSSSSEEFAERVTEILRRRKK